MKIKAISCSNCGKETEFSLDNMNTNYKDIVTVFVLNKLLNHVVMSWIIEAHEKLRYYMEKHIPDWTTGGPWYNTSICKRIHVIVFKDCFFKIQ